MNLARAIATIGGFTMISRVTGFARDMMIANFLGAGVMADAFFVAFKFPNLFRRLFAEGAFSAAFVPLYAGLVEQDGLDGARKFAEEAMAVLTWSLVAVIALLEIFMPWAMLAFAPGFREVPGKMELATELTRITFPYLLFISLVSLQGGVLNSLGRFAAAAATPVLLNLSLIGALLTLAPHTATPGHALAWGTTAAGVLQFLWLAVSIRRAGVRLRMRRPRLGPRIRLLMKRILPGAVGAGMYQVNLLVDTIVASLVGTGAVSYLYYADRVNQLPLGVVGTAVGTALLPILSRQLRAGNVQAAQYSQNRTLEFALLLTLPAALALLAVAWPIVAVLFMRGQFTAVEAEATAAALAAFAPGLPAYVLVKVFTPAFFAREDTATPVKVAAVAMVANIAFMLVLMGPLAHVGIALATSASAWVNAGLLAWLLKRRGFLVLDDRLKRRVPRILAAAMAMAAGLWWATAWLAPLWTGPLWQKAGALALLVSGGAAVFGIVVLAIGGSSLADVKVFVRRKVA